jgi:hypothetical protein
MGEPYILTAPRRWNLNSSVTEGSKCKLERLLPVFFFRTFREIRRKCLKRTKQQQSAYILGLNHIQAIKNTTMDKHKINLDLRNILSDLWPIWSVVMYDKSHRMWNSDYCQLIIKVWRITTSPTE